MVRKNPFSEYEKVGESKVRELLAAGRFGNPGSYNHDKASSWLKLLDDKRALVSAERAEAREEEKLFISRRALQSSIEANSIASRARDDARSARRIALIAVIFSGIIAIMAIISNMSKIIFILQQIGILKP
jgi:hypothetical protein